MSFSGITCLYVFAILGGLIAAYRIYQNLQKLRQRQNDSWDARLIDQLLRFPPVDQKTIQEIAALNGLRKIELLDTQGQPLKLTPAQQRMEEMMAQKREFHSEDFLEKRHPMMTFMWGRRWNLPQSEGRTPPKVAEKKFWEGSVFGVAIGASGRISSRSFTRSLRIARVFSLVGLARMDRWPSARGPVSAAPWKMPTTASSAMRYARRSAMRSRSARVETLPSPRWPISPTCINACSISACVGGNPQ